MKKYIIFIGTFFGIVFTQFGYAQGINLDEVILTNCNPDNDFYDLCECEPAWCDSGDPCDFNSSAYNEDECYGNNGEQDCNGDTNGYAYDSYCGCIGGNTGITECPENQNDEGNQDDQTQAQGNINVSVQGNTTSNNPGKEYVPKATDILVKPNIVTTCEPQSKLPVCVLTSLEVTLNNVIGLTVTAKEIGTAAILNTLDLNILKNGMNPEQTKNFLTSFCETEPLKKADFKQAIDDGNTFITDIKTGEEIKIDSSFPDDRTKDTTTIITHSISVIGYDEEGNFIYIDPALGKAQVAPSTNMAFSYALIITGTK